MRRILGLGAAFAVAIAPAAVTGQGLSNMIPGLGGNSAASVDPDAFLQEATETTKLVMIAAAVLRAASEQTTEMSSISARISAIQGAESIGELDAMQADFRNDVSAVGTTAEDMRRLEQAYAAADANRRALMSAAAYNFVLGMARNARLAQQAPELGRSMRSNPMLLMKVGSVLGAGRLLTEQVRVSGAMLTYARAILRQGGVEEPQDRATSEPMPVVL